MGNAGVKLLSHLDQPIHSVPSFCSEELVADVTVLLGEPADRILPVSQCEPHSEEKVRALGDCSAVPPLRRCESVCAQVLKVTIDDDPCKINAGHRPITVARRRRQPNW